MSYKPHSLFLTYYDRACTGYGVTWHADGFSEPVLQIVRDKPDFSAAVNIPASAESGSGDTVLRAVTTPLEFSSVYYYRVGDGGEFSPAGKIETREQSPGDFSFLYVTDSQDGVNFGTFFKACLDRAYSLYPDIKFILHGGDIVNMGGDETHWRRLCENIYPYSLNRVIMPAAGNHDYWDWALCGNSHTCYRHFTLDLPRQNTYRGIYYSFDYGGAHFTVLNSGDTVECDNGLSADQLRWLEEDLRGAGDKWKITVIHNPLYSPGKYGSDETKNQPALKIAQQLNPVFARYKVALCLNGHDHVYSRSYPINASGEPDKSPPLQLDGIDCTSLSRGCVHHMAGCCGNQNRDFFEGLSEKYTYRLCDILPMERNTAAASYISVTDNALAVEYSAFDVDTGEITVQKRFGIIK